MTQEEKELLFIDLCGRLPYGVMVSVQGGEFESHKYPYQLTAVSKFGLDCLCKVYHPIYTPFGTPKVEDVKPYLRPMSSMTKEEFDEYMRFIKHSWEGIDKEEDDYYVKVKDRDVYIDWLNAHHFDYRGLIEKGLALEAKKDMYKNE